MRSENFWPNCISPSFFSLTPGLNFEELFFVKYQESFTKCFNSIRLAEIIQSMKPAKSVWYVDGLKSDEAFSSFKIIVKECCSGRHGLGDECDRYFPVLVETPKNAVIIDLYCGFDRTVFITKTGKLLTCGSNEFDKCAQKQLDKQPVSIVLKKGEETS